MATLLALVGLIAMMVGLISLVKPLTALRIRTRAMGLGVLAGGLILTMIAGSMVTPSPSTQSASSNPPPSQEQAQTQPSAHQAAPREVPKIEISGQFDPAILLVGQKLVVKFGISNLNDEPINGVRLFSDGPWKKFTIVNVMPNGTYGSTFLGTEFASGMVIPPGETRWLNIIAYPTEPGNYELTFIPHPLDGGDFTDAAGERIVIGGKVAVLPR
ncbi:MAG: hypothetical protein QME79_14325 [Bacillota bacterium]|nr:hypothetical protein [Bacillota bacterium]